MSKAAQLQEAIKTVMDGQPALAMPVPAIQTQLQRLPVPGSVAPRSELHTPLA